MRDDICLHDNVKNWRYTQKNNTCVSKWDNSFLVSKMLKWDLDPSGYELDWT
jgi:hypothetical protein